MKAKHILSLAGCLGVLLSTQAKAVDFNFQVSPQVEPGTDLGTTSKTFTESGLSITASSFDTSGTGTPPDLFSKFTSGVTAETGLGLANDSNFEIDTTHFIQLDFSAVVPASSVTITISSIQSGESALVFASPTPGSHGAVPIYILDGSAGVMQTVDVTPFVNAGNFIDVQAGAVNVLIETVSVVQQQCPCVAHDIQYNFNGTQIIFQNTPGGSYVWFISDGKVSGLPANTKTVLHVYDQSITIPATGSSPKYVIPVPDSFITFDPTVNTATTTFDTVNNVWLMTFPTAAMAGNIFYGGVAFKVPVAGLPGGIKNVDWSGKFASVTPGLTVAWQWHAANYSNFTSNYNSIAPKPTDDNHVSIYQNSDHAGTPEGIDPISLKPWKSFVVGGASGGGGANYTGSGSSTIQFPPCDCP